MEKRLLHFSFSLFFVAVCFSQTTPDSTSTGRRLIKPSIYLDYGKLLTIPFDFETKYEGGIEVLLLEKFPVILEAGAGTLAPEGAYSNGTYESSGWYYRVGTGYVGPYDGEHDIGLTFRFASSTFDEIGRIQLESTSGVQGVFTQNIERENLSAQWWEIVLYSDRKLSDMFSIGLNVRLRIMQSYDSFEEIDVYAIPGYGRAFDNTTPAANFFFKVSF